MSFNFHFKTQNVDQSYSKTLTQQTVMKRTLHDSEYIKRWRKGIRDIPWESVVSKHYIRHFRTTVLHNFLVVHGYHIEDNDGELFSAQKCILLIYRHQYKMSERSNRRTGEYNFIKLIRLTSDIIYTQGTCRQLTTKSASKELGSKFN